ncbi:hypothetical protein ACVWXN_010403 [Bradyrhizobium sp. i1.4.4]
MAEETKALRRSCKRLVRRSEEWIHSAMAARNAQTTMPPISASQTKLGSSLPGGAKLSESAKARAGATALPRHTTACTAIGSVLPTCQFFSAISHPRFQRRIVWLHGFGSGKRLYAQQKNVTPNTAIALT